MNNNNRQYGICGVYCGQCPNGNGRVKMMAMELKRLVDTTRYNWVKEVSNHSTSTNSEKASNGSPKHNAPCASTVEEHHVKTENALLIKNSKAASYATNT